MAATPPQGCGVAAATRLIISISHGCIRPPAPRYDKGHTLENIVVRLVPLVEADKNGTATDLDLTDGGGVRGYSMLILLHDFMHKTYSECYGEPPEPDQVPKPCDYFDLIAGTGTGGLIAIMLGRLRMNTKDCMRVYVQMTRKVFETDKTIAGIPYRSTLFKASMLEDAIRACVRSFENNEDGLDVPDSPDTFGSRPQSVMSDKNGMPRSSTSTSSRQRWSHIASDSYGVLGDPNAPLEDPRRDRRCKT